MLRPPLAAPAYCCIVKEEEPPHKAPPCQSGPPGKPCNAGEGREDSVFNPAPLMIGKADSPEGLTAPFPGSDVAPPLRAPQYPY